MRQPTAIDNLLGVLIDSLPPSFSINICDPNILQVFPLDRLPLCWGRPCMFLDATYGSVVLSNLIFFRFPSCVSSYLSPSLLRIIDPSLGLSIDISLGFLFFPSYHVRSSVCSFFPLFSLLNSLGIPIRIYQIPGGVIG